MFRRKNYMIAVFVLFLIVCASCLPSITLAQDEANDAKIIERYKLMLSRKPKEGSNSTQRISLHASSSQTYFVNKNSTNKPSRSTRRSFSSKQMTRIACA